MIIKIFKDTFFNRYRRKRPKVDASIFDSALSHTRRSDASKKREENSVSAFGRFRLWTSFGSSPVSVKLVFTIRSFWFRAPTFLKRWRIANCRRPKLYKVTRQLQNTHPLTAFNTNYKNIILGIFILTRSISRPNWRQFLSTITLLIVLTAFLIIWSISEF